MLSSSSNDNRRQLSPYTVYLILDGSFAFFFMMIFTSNLLYQANVVGLTPLQLVLVGTMLEAVIFVFQVPTGVIADVFSRRLAILAGMITVGIGYMIEGAIPSFAAVLFAQVLFGLGITSVMGAQQAWLSDEIGEENAGKVFIRAAQIGQVGGLLGILPSVILGSIALNIPVFIGGLGLVLTGVILSFVMPENGFKPTPREDRTTWQQMLKTTRDGFQLARSRPTLLLILAVGLFYGLTSEGYDRLWREHLQQNFTFPSIGNFQPVVWFGLIGAVLSVIGIVLNEAIRRRLDTNNHLAITRLQLFMNVLMVLGFFIFAMAGNFLMAVLAIGMISLMRDSISPIRHAWINQHVESHVRATLFSIDGQLDALGQIVGGPIFGLIATAFSLRLEMGAVGISLIPALLILFWMSRREKPAPVETVPTGEIIA